MQQLDPSCNAEQPSGQIFFHGMALVKNCFRLVQRKGVSHDSDQPQQRPRPQEQSNAIRDQLDAAARSSDQRLKDKKGADFEKAYIEEQVTMHQTVLDTIDTQLMPNAKAEELKALLTKTRSTVASHLDHAKQLQNSKAAM
jgi:putative membrane protein